MIQDHARHFAPRRLVRDAPQNHLLTAEEERASHGRGGFVYRFYSADQEALYIGVTSGAAFRWVEHRRSSGWWSLAEYVALSFYGTYEAALLAETAGIKAERPSHNRQGLKPRRRMDIQFRDGAKAIAAELHKVAPPALVRDLARLLATPELFPQPLPPPSPDFADR